MTRVRLVLVWPAWQRLLHWALAASVVAAIATHELGRPHEVIDYATLALALLRIGLGIAGPREARFTSFVRGASATLAYARAVRARAAPRRLNHNPLGAWMCWPCSASSAWRPAAARSLSPTASGAWPGSPTCMRE